MKKGLAVCLMIVMIAMSLISAVAAEGEDAVSSMEDALIIHWDFEGSTLEEQLKNKAANGSDKDNLTLHTAGNLTTVENGVARLSSKTSEYFNFVVDTAAGVGSNLVETANQEMTFYIRFKMNGTASSTSTPFTFNHKNRNAFMTRGYVNTEGGFTVRFNNNKTWNTNVPDNTMFDDAYSAVVVTYKRGELGAVEMTVYVAYYDWAEEDDIKNMKKNSVTTYEGDLWKDGSDITLGKMYNQIQGATGEVDLGKVFLYDDIRVYNRVLTEAEIQTLKQQGTTTQPGDDTEPLPQPGSSNDTTVTEKPSDNGPTAEAPTDRTPTAVESDTAPDSSQPAEKQKRGCSSAVTLQGGGIILVCLMTLALAKRKKRDQEEER